jgi:uncharacterized membrane protein
VTTEPHDDADLAGDGAGFSYFRRHCSSLDWRLLSLVFGSLALFLVLVAAAFAAAGAWLIIPFAGVEIVALGIAAWWTLRRAGDYERLAFDGDRILVEIREQGLSRRFEFNRCWARLVTGDAGTVALRSHGREIAIGRFCGEEGRQVLARELRSRLGDQRI